MSKSDDDRNDAPTELQDEALDAVDGGTLNLTTPTPTLSPTGGAPALNFDQNPSIEPQFEQQTGDPVVFLRKRPGR